ASGRGYSPGQHEGRLQAAGRSFPEGNPVAPPLHATSSPSPHRRSGPSPQAAHSDRQSSSVSVDPSRPKSAWEKRGKVYHSAGEAFGKDDGRRLRRTTPSQQTQTPPATARPFPPPPGPERLDARS